MIAEVWGNLGAFPKPPSTKSAFSRRVLAISSWFENLNKSTLLLEDEEN
ncbi:MAG: hypothetical protein ABI653_06425 [Bacteroidota bacterium]